MHSLTAKPLGFPAAIAHGMWTKARCLAALESPPARRLHGDGRFRRPILLPAPRSSSGAEDGTAEIEFAVRDAKKRPPTSKGA